MAMRISGFLLLAATGLSMLGALGTGCGSTATAPPAVSGSCAAPPAVGQNDYCKSCTRAANASPDKCSEARPVDACCAWVQSPAQAVLRSTGLHYFSGADTTADFSCLTSPGTLGATKNVTLTGHVKLFSSGIDSSGVKIEIFKEGPDGALGELVGVAVTTVKDDALDPAQDVDWLTKCLQGSGAGCKFRSFTYLNVPTETPLIIRTSDANAAGTWKDLYDYNVYFSNASAVNDQVKYDPSAVASTDVNTVASAAGGFTVKDNQGVIAGEVHDCSDARVSGATVDTDQGHEGPMFYFTDNEADPLPDAKRGPQGLGTSKLGLFGALNFATGRPIRISAVGKISGQPVLLGTYTVQVYAGAVTALSLRGRRPWQK